MSAEEVSKAKRRMLFFDALPPRIRFKLAETGLNSEEAHNVITQNMQNYGMYGGVPVDMIVWLCGGLDEAFRREFGCAPMPQRDKRKQRTTPAHKLAPHVRTVT